MNKDNLLPLDESIALKKIGFNTPCYFAYHTEKNSYSYDNEIGDFFQNEIGDCENYNDYDELCSTTIPSVVLSWFRDTHNLIAVPHYVGGDWKHYDILIHDNLTGDEIEYAPIIVKTYEEAELECVRFLISIVIEKYCNETTE